MKLKNIFSKGVGLTALSALTLFASCDSKLDIDPEQSIGSDVALSTPKGLQTALIGAYERLQGGQLYGTNINLLSELLAASGQELQWSGTFLGYRQVFSKNMVADNSEATRTWIRAYDAINVANNVIANVGVVEDEAERDRILGEALFIRGIVYFDLVRFYAQPWSAGNVDSNLGVPLVLEPTTSITDEANVSRATVGAVYAQVIDDLTRAKTLLPESNGTRADTYAASAFLARVYLSQADPNNDADEDYDKAGAEADRVISSGEFSLIENYENVFNNSSDNQEYVFAIQQNTQSNAGSSNDGLATFYANLNGIGRGDVDIIPGFVANTYSATDERTEIYYVDEDGILRNGKYTDPFANIPVIRLAEMYLIRAEAAFRNGNVIQALADINKIRSRADLTPLLAVTLNDILLERKRELAFEGNALHEAKRLQRTVGALPYNSPKLVLPIPQRERDVNPNLEQNPGY
ncbi:RagB/SusD family nutrient uptake outer membrane protein [Pontibacter sp. MBLB2868]|uniref:RagB/SusD family nutrient uptake outer membrane protein n=1 Tax=Pontibacter sp. MBLB2868 TaxID=3451555 RepID=UPI003F75311E